MGEFRQPGAQSAAERKRQYRLETEIAPERFEHFEAPRYQFSITRRELWRTLAGGILLTVTLPLATKAQDAGGAKERDSISTRFLFADSGEVTLLTGKIEMGQGARTLLSQAAAEELGLPVQRVRVLMGDTDLCPDDGGTWASLTTPQTVPVVRQAGAVARQIFLNLAASRLGVGAASLTVADGRISSGAARSLSYVELARLAREQQPDGVSADVSPPSGWKTLGQSVPNVRAREIVTGALKYGCDDTEPGMLHGKMVRGPHYKGNIALIRGEARLPAGAGMVRDGDFLGVFAPDPLSAEAAASAIRVVWRGEPLTAETKLSEHFVETAREPVHRPGERYPGLIVRGDPLNAYWSSPQRLESKYSLAYIAHVPLETRSAIALWEGDKVTIRLGCQAPFMARREVAQAFGIPEGNVRIVSQEIGGGYGGKQRGEAAVEAARLAREAGKPVKLTWNREEEFHAGYVRPAGYLEVRSGMDAQGKLRAWEFHNYNSGASGIACHYDIPHAWCGYHPANSPLRQGSYRSLAAVANTFARELHIEEWAARLREDPISFRLRNTADERLKEVLQRGAEQFGWGKGGGRPGVAQGVACNLEKDARLALFVELQASGTEVKLLRALMAFDPGAVLNPDNLRNQIEGAVSQGIGGALFERMEYDDTKLRSTRLARYRVPRFLDVPKTEVLLIDRREIPAAGAGEAPITVVAPAIAAAIHRVTGHWLRQMPLLPALAAATGGRSASAPRGG